MTSTTTPSTECGWQCGDPAPDHKHHSVLVREDGKLLGRLTPNGTANQLKIYAAVLSHERASWIAGQINSADDNLTAKVIPF